MKRETGKSAPRSVQPSQCQPVLVLAAVIGLQTVLQTVGFLQLIHPDPQWLVALDFVPYVALVARLVNIVIRNVTSRSRSKLTL